MRGFLIRFLISILALWLTGIIARSIHLKIQVDSFWAAFSAVILLGFINAVIAPILRLLTLPLSCMTLGLFGFVINALLFWLVSALVPGFQVGGFLAALFGSVVMGVLTAILYTLTGTRR